MIFSNSIFIFVAIVSFFALLLYLLKYRKDKNEISANDFEVQTLLDERSSALKENENESFGGVESLLEFLRFKSEKPTIEQNKFNLNNVLNELAGSLGEYFKGADIELVFDTDNNVPKNLLGDPLQLGNVLFSLTKGMIDRKSETEIRVSVKEHRSFKFTEGIIFEISNKEINLSKKERDLLLMTNDDAISKEERGMEFYLAKELVSLMNGEISIKSNTISGTEVVVSIPLKAYDPNKKRKYRLPSKEMVGKKVFLVDSHESSALAIKKMFQYFRYEVEAVSAVDFRKKKPNLSFYDIIIFDEKMLDIHLHSYINQIKKQEKIKVILLSSVFSTQDNAWADGIVDSVAKKPFSQERIFEIIVDLYGRTNDHTPMLADSEGKQENDRLVHRELFEDIPDISMSSFIDFAEKSVLIVDDNKINQKILINVLGRSKMHLDIASNGQEAVDLTAREGNKYDIILMDINMPIMDGYTATSVIREDAKYYSVPIVALTALVLDSEVEKMFAKGVSGYLSKPLKVGQLYAALDFFLAKNIKKQIDDKSCSAPRHIYGLNTIQGTAHCNGNIIAYVGILNEFVTAYGESDVVVRHLTDDHKYAQIKILCNDMRRLTKIIGAYKMHEVADKMYKLFLYGNEEMIPKYVEAYRRELGRLKVSIREYLEGSKNV
ncbi:MAG: response regulator [Sulfurovum sp.]|nr:response regulator [Sulfurovum sp.]